MRVLIELDIPDDQVDSKSDLDAAIWYLLYECIDHQDGHIPVYSIRLNKRAHQATGGVYAL